MQVKIEAAKLNAAMKYIEMDNIIWMRKLINATGHGGLLATSFQIQ